MLSDVLTYVRRIVIVIEKNKNKITVSYHIPFIVYILLLLSFYEIPKRNNIDIITGITHSVPIIRYVLDEFSVANTDFTYFRFEVCENGVFFVSFLT